MQLVTMFLSIIIAIVLLLIVYLYLKFYYKYWERRGVPSDSSSLLFGTLKDAVFFREAIATTYGKLYNKYKKYPYMGVFEIREPALLVFDIKLIKNILLNDSKHFIDNGFDVDAKVDPVFSQNPFFLKGVEWKIGRNKTTPLFTSSKMKSIFNGMMIVGKKLRKHLENNPMQCVSAKELVRRYTADIVGEAAFGLNVNALEDPQSLFVKMYKTIFDDSLWSEIKQFFALWLPGFLASLLNGQFVPNETDKFIRDIVNNAVKHRKENNIIANDYLGSLLQILEKRCEGAVLDRDSYNEIYIQFTGLLTDGMETSSVFMQFLLYEIAANPDVQERLKEEIDATLAKYGQLTYESLQDMRYLDRVFQETLRKYPPLPINLKVCTEPYILPAIDAKSKPVTIEKDMKIVIPTLALHLDPDYFPEPHRFNPDRFLDENANSMNKNAYIPFGDGPRKCIGRRFAEQQSKIAVISIVKEFEMTVNKKTIAPIEFATSILFIAPKGGIWLDFHKRVF